MLLSSCETDFGEGGMSPISGKVAIKVFEGPEHYEEAGVPSVLLEMHTEQIYPCMNFTIIGDVSTGQGLISVMLRGVYEPELCLTAFGPATYRRALPIGPGVYQLVVYNGFTSDRHTLEVTNSLIRIVPGTSAVSTIPARLSWRIPVCSFAYVCGTTTETGWMCEDFADSLLKIPGLREFSFPDSGEIPYPSVSSGTWHTEPARYFLYATEADYDSAGALLGRYTHAVIGDRQGILLYLLNWRNVWYRSWMM